MYTFGLKSLVDPRRGEFPKFVPEMELLGQLPAEVDYTVGYPEADNQGPFGTCVAFGNKKVFEFFRAKRTGNKDLISARALYSEIKHSFYPGDVEDNGAQVSDGIRILEQNYVFDEDMPYDTSNFARCLDPVPANIKHTDFVIKNYVAVTIDVQDFELALHSHGPIVVGVDWQNEFMSPGADGRLACGETSSAGGHCVAILGYNREFVNLDNSKGAFIVINNWGTWGKNGYCYLPYSKIELISDAFTVAA